MKEFFIKTFAYNCKCGYAVRVFVDSGVPMEQYRCRNCGSVMKRNDG